MLRVILIIMLSIIFLYSYAGCLTFKLLCWVSYFLIVITTIRVKIRLFLYIVALRAKPFYIELLSQLKTNLIDEKVKDPAAPVEFYINGDLVVSNDRVEVKDLGEGKRQLIINKAEMGDNGTVTAKTPSNRGNEVAYSGNLPSHLPPLPSTSPSVHEYVPGVIFSTVHFLCNLRMDLIRYSVCTLKLFPA